MKKPTKTSPKQVGFSFEASPPEPRGDEGTKIVSLTDYAAAQERAKRAEIYRAIMARAAHLTTPPPKA